VLWSSRTIRRKQKQTDRQRCYDCSCFLLWLGCLSFSRQYDRTMTAIALRQKVLSLYRTVLRLGRTWVASDPRQTETERDYIVHEARTLFRKNRHVNRPWIYIWNVFIVSAVSYFFTAQLWSGDVVHWSWQRFARSKNSLGVIYPMWNWTDVPAVNSCGTGAVIMISHQRLPTITTAFPLVGVSNDVMQLHQAMFTATVVAADFSYNNKLNQFSRQP